MNIRRLSFGLMKQKLYFSVTMALVMFGGRRGRRMTVKNTILIVKHGGGSVHSTSLMGRQSACIDACISNNELTMTANCFRLDNLE